MAEVVDVLLRARMEASGVEAGVGQIQKSLQGLTLPKGISNELEKSFSKLTPLLKDYQKQLNKGFSNKKDLQNFNALKEKISETFGEIRGQVQSVNSQKIRLKVDTQEIDKLENQIVSKTAKLQEALSKVFTKTVNTESIKEQLDKVISNTGKAATVKPMADLAKQLFNSQDYAAYNNKIDEIKNKILSLKTTKVDLATALGVKDAAKNIDVANDKIEKFFNNLKVNEGKVQTIEHLKQELQELGVNLENVKLESLTKGTGELQGVEGLIEQLASSIRDTGNAAGEAGQSMVRMVDEVNDLKTSTQYFFSLRNMINLLKRGIDDAVQSVKELDKAMTETAVVTDFSVADMWKDLPKYTKIANDLGATTQGAYETMTLYYQQGLNQQQAFELGAETMKMARIAGLDYAETTDMMTAALRGFNMELDETSAKRVNDVYSKLAAVTASDTEELGTAMQRTASIAHSAGMSFEGTTAFLAQAIETTREPAENIGTAMKTIVARFQEMKKNPLEISEVDGEEVSYNKVDQALQSIGVSLKDTNGQFRELDQVFLDISSRWDSLSQVQQRYIATTAAGSRQQSRFIAMMDNYDRTMQLMEAATDSAGASDEQFGKTMDSLESKLNKLHNAWQAFTMGIANNNMIKLAVDGLTGFLTITNKIIDTLSLGSGAIKSFLSVFAAFTGLKTGGKAINALIGGLGGLVDPQKTFKEGLKTGFFGSGKDQLQADRISNPIVKAINGLIPVIQGKVEGGANAFNFGKNGSYGAARANLSAMLKEGGFKEGGKYRLKDIRTILDQNQLNPEQQKNFFRSSPGLTKNIAKNLGNALEQAGAKPEVAQGLAKGFQRGEFSLDEVLLKGGLGITADEHYNKLNTTNPEEATKFRNSLIQKGIQKGLKDKDLENYIKNSVIPTEAGEEFLSQLQQMSSAEKVADGLGKAGAALTNFGSNLQMVGANLSTVNPQLGQFISGLGNMMTTAGSAVSALSNLANPIALIGVAVGAAIYMDQKRLQGIRDAADKVTESYKNIHDQTTENINNLKSYQNEFASLVEGVDRNGNNISLDTSQYDRYLEIVDEIARLNPEIVEGYNAQGHAIITNNEALDETIKKQKQLQDEATKKYLDDDSLDKLIKARDINNDYIDSLIDRKTKGQIQKTYGEVNDQTISQFMGKQTTLSPQAMAIGKQIEKSDLYKENKQAVNEILGQYNITLTDLEAGEQKAVNVFKAHSADIKSQLATAAGIADVEFSDKFNTAFDQWDTSLSSFNESIEGIYQNLSTSISSSGLYDEIDTKLRPAFQAGLKDIAATGDTAKQMKADAAALATEFSNLTNSSSDYAKAMEQVTDLQDQFANDLDADAYTKAINAEDGPIAVLNEQLELLEGRTDAAAQAQREFLENEIDSITKFTESSFGNLTSALNTLQDDIAEAEGAFETFSKSVESDYSTAVKGMQSIYDKVFEELDIEGSTKKLHTQGYGDKTFWAGAEALLGKDAVSKKGADVNSLTKQMERLKPALQQGEAGYYGFLDLINTKYQNANEKTKAQMENLIGTFKDGRLDEFNLDQDNFAEVAKLLGMSDNALTSMLHNAMQFADLDFMDSDAVRKTLATSNEAIAGEGKTGDKQNLFVSEDYLRQQVLDAGYRPEKVEGILDKLDKQGIKTIPSAKELGSGTSAYFKENLGVNTQKELIEKLNATGTFNKEQIADYAKNMMGEKVFDPKQFAQDYNDVINSQEHPIDTAQLNELTSIHSVIANILANMDPEHDQSIADMVSGFKSEILGTRAGADTVSERFAQGRDAEGNALTSKTYESARQNLLDIDAGLTAAIDKLKVEAQTASGEHLSFLNEQIQGLERLKSINNSNKEAGEKAYQAIEKENKAKTQAHKLGGHLPEETQQKPQNTTSTDTKKTVLTAEDNASPVIEDAQSKADTFDNTKAEADVTADTADANKDLEKTEDKLNTLDGKKAETKVTTTTEEPKAPTVPTNTTATVSIIGDNQQAIASAQQTVSTINGLQSKIIVGANTDAALAKARGLARTISGLSAKVKVTAYYSGGTITIPTKANPIHPHHTGGFVVPGGPIYRAKGGSIFKPKGTDIIPAMLTPGEYVQKRDAVEYFGVDFMRQINHKNLPGALASLDKKINYRSSGGIISYLGNGGDVHGKVNYNWGNGGVTVTVNTGSSNKGNNNTNKSNKGNKSTDKAAETIEKASKDINSWWEKISRQVKEAEKKTKRIGEQVTKVFNDLRASINAVNEVNKDFIDKQKQIIALNQEVVTKSNQKLDILESGTETDAYVSAKANKAAKDKAEKKAKKAYKKKKSKKNKKAWDKAKAEQEEAAQELQAVTPDEVIEANKAYQAAKKAYKKKKTKANKKAVKTAKAAYDKAVEEATKKGENWETIEWQQTKVTKDKKGKKKEKKTDKSEKINLSDYIEKDENGVYFVNQAKIDEVYKKDAEKAEAIQKAAYEKIDEWVNRRDEAEENITGAEDELAKYRKDIDDTFFGWKNELTEVLRITNEIERTEAEINQLQAERERTQLHLDNLDLGFGGTGTGGDLNKYFDEFKQQILKNIELNSKEASQKAALIEANQEEMRAMAALTDATVKYEDINGEVQEETEKAMYQRISTITANGTGTGWDELSTQEKKIFARQQLFQRNLVSGSAEQGYSLQQGGLKQYLQDIKNGQIQEELGSLLKEVFDELNDKTFENLKLETEIYQAKTENEKLEQEITDKANDLNEQLYGWKNSLTKVLELTQKIEQAEKRTAYLKATDEYYNRRSLSGESVSSADILATYMGQMISVVSEIQSTNEKIEAQRADLQSYLNGDEIFREYRSLTNSAPNDVAIAKLEKLEKELRIRQLALEYGNIHQNEDGTVSVSYNSAKLEQDIGSRFDASTGSEIEKFYKDIIDKSNDIRDLMQSSLTKMSDLQQNLIDLRQAYADNAEKVLSAYVNQQQKIIDNLKTVYSSIDNNFKELINSVKQNLQQRHQAEDNIKTQQDISKKQQRLSMLRADTAGGNQVAIAQLQKEIADAQQNYGRTLEDQLLEQMSIQGDTAAKQRERQIELLQAQYNIAKDTGIYAKQVDDWLRNGQYKDTIYTLLKNDIGIDAMTAEKRAISLASIDTDIQDLATFPSKIDATKTAIDSLSTIIGGNEETGQLSLADEISSTVGDAVINASTSTIESFNELVLKLFGDGKQNVGAFNALQSSIAASLTSSLSTVLGQKLFGDQKGNVGAFSTLNTAISTVNNTLTGAISTKIGSITTAIGQIKLGASPEDVKEALAKVEAARKTEKESTELTAAKNQATLAAASAKTAQDNAQAAATALANTQTNLTAVNTINTNVNTIKTTLSNIKTSLDNLSLVASNTKYLGDMSPDLEDIKQEVVRSTNTTTYNGLINALHTEGTINKTEFVKAVNAGAAEGVNKSAGLVAKDLAAGDGAGGTTWVEVLKAAKGAGYTGTTIKQWFPDAPSNGAFRKAFENVYGKWSKFASGGIADYTGPAWLDGTPSKPELVLNATDTRNFLMLRDVLNNVMGSIDSSNGTYGGNATYEININVDRLTNDYDVDKVAERVKKIIVKDSGYRNVTQVRNFR